MYEKTKDILNVINLNYQINFSQTFHKLITINEVPTSNLRIFRFFLRDVFYNVVEFYTRIKSRPNLCEHKIGN